MEEKFKSHCFIHLKRKGGDSGNDGQIIYLAFHTQLNNAVCDLPKQLIYDVQCCTTTTLLAYLNLMVHKMAVQHNHIAG